MKLLTISLFSISCTSATVIVPKNSPATLEQTLVKRQPLVFCVMYCCALKAYRAKRMEIAESRKKYAEFEARRPPGQAWKRSNDDNPYPMPQPGTFGLIIPVPDDTTSTGGIPTETSEPTNVPLTEPVGVSTTIIQPIEVTNLPASSTEIEFDPLDLAGSFEPRYTETPNSELIQAPSPSYDDPVWYPTIGPFFIEGGNVAQWIMFKKKPDNSDQSETVNELMGIISDHARKSAHNRLNKPWKHMEPTKDQLKISSSYSEDCLWYRAIDAIEAEDGDSIHWFRLKAPPQGSTIDMYGPDFQYFISKSKHYRELLDGLLLNNQ